MAEPRDEDDEDTGNLDEVRLDRWLLAARYYKTRPLAIEACNGGLVSVNGANAKPARAVRVGDRVEAQTPRGLRIGVIKALGEKRGSAEVARALYEDLSPPPPPPREKRLEATIDVLRGEGRPSRKEREKLERLRGW
jgi:ribosome-associated heat shock protein Hsp15